MSRVRPLLFGLLGAFWAGPGLAITISATHDTQALARALFGDLAGLAFTAASLSHGADAAGQPARKTEHQAAVFSNADRVYGLPATGVALSTGDVRDYAAGPNLNRQTQTLFGGRATAQQQALLAPITGKSAHFDTVMLDFAFEAPVDVVGLSFRAVFGTEDFPEFKSAFADGFGLFVNGVNVALAPVNGAPFPLSSGHPAMAAIPGTELDGVIAPGGDPVLRFDVALRPGEANRVTLLLADGVDQQSDSTVFLAGGLVRIEAGATETMPVLPSGVNEAGGFVLDLPEVPAGATVWIDPPVSVGFEYEALGGAAFASVTAPTLAVIDDPDGYFITVGGATVALAPGETLDFLATFDIAPVSFVLDGIDPLLMLDPTNPTLFPTGVSFDRISTGTTVIMTPIVVDFSPSPVEVGAVVPLPAGAWLMGGAFGLAAFVLRRRRPAAPGH